MAQTNVSSCVLSIVASFTSGLDVFKRFRETQGKKKPRISKQRKAALEDEEVQLARSLRRGPEDIGREYQRSIQAVGEQFASGDAIAQTSLAEILLKLNTGLVSIINTFLSRGDQRDVHLDYRSLTNLSERSRLDTCRTLRQLYHRTMQLRRPLQVGSNQDLSQHRPPEKHRVRMSGTGKNKTKPASTVASSAKHTRVRSPMLARVVIADSTKPSQVALVRPGERKKKSRSSLGSASSKVQSNDSLALPAPTPLLLPSTVPELPIEPFQRKSHAGPDPPKVKRKPATIAVNGDSPSSGQEAFQQPLQVLGPQALRAAPSAAQLENTMHQHDQLPPMHRTARLPPFEPRRRKATPTYYSIETTSTRLGEIPLHKWAEPYDFDAMSQLNKEAELSGWPLSEYVPNPARKRKGLGLFRMFRRNRAQQV